MNVHQLFMSGALVVGALSVAAFAAAASPAAATTGAPDAAPVAGAASSASETAAEQAATARLTAFAVAPTCASWTDAFERFNGVLRSPLGFRFVVHIPTTTRNDSRGQDCVLRPGTQGAGVFILQDSLIKCYSQRITQDAIYGNKTAEAVKNVQNFHRILGPIPILMVDGVYGPATRSAMKFAKYHENGVFSHCF